MRYRMGKPDAPIAVIGTADQPAGNPRRGTEITFLPSSKIFVKTGFDFMTIERRLRDLAHLHVGATIALSERRGSESIEVVLDL